MAEMARRSVLQLTALGLVGSACGVAGNLGLPGAARSFADEAAEVLGTVLYETSFEDPAETFWIGDESTFDTTTARTGARSLTVNRTDVDAYDPVKRTIQVKPGRTYQASVHAKVAAITNPQGKNTAMLAMEAHDETGAWITGAYSKVVIGADWTQTNVVFAPPLGTASVTVLLYLYTKVLGEAWFDDLEVVEVAEVEFQTVLEAPSYRGLLIPGDHDQVQLRSRVALPAAELSQCSVDVALMSGTTIVASSTVAAQAEVTYSLPASQISAGSYQLRARLVDTGTSTVRYEETWPIRKLASSAEVPATYVDRHGRFIRDGEPFLVLGFYTARVDQTNLGKLAGTPFNTLLSYGTPTAAQLDLASDAGVNVIYPVNNYYYGAVYAPDDIDSEAAEIPYLLSVVNQVKEHPAILAWYQSDELDTGVFGGRMIAHQEALVIADPDHPTLAVDAKPASVHTMLRATDIYGIDAYPIPGSSTAPISKPAMLTADAAAGLPNRGLWPVVQSFAKSSYPPQVGPYPTLDEMRSMAWQYLVRGGKGLLLYSLHNMDDVIDGVGFETVMSNAVTVANQIVDMKDVILSVDPIPEITVAAPATISWTARSHQGSTYVLAVSAARQDLTAHPVTFSVPGAQGVTVVGEGRSLTVGPDGVFEDGFAPLAVHLYEVSIASFESVERLTRIYLESNGNRAGNGLARSASRNLVAARRASERDDDNAKRAHLTAYQQIVESARRNGALTEGQEHTLRRLAESL